MTCGLVHASYSLSEWQAVKLTFFAPCSHHQSCCSFALTSTSVTPPIWFCGLPSSLVSSRSSEQPIFYQIFWTPFLHTLCYLEVALCSPVLVPFSPSLAQKLLLFQFLTSQNHHCPTFVLPQHTLSSPSQPLPTS